MKEYYCHKCGSTLEETHSLISVGRDAELCLDCLRDEYMRLRDMKTQVELTSVNECLPSEDAYVLVKTRNKYVSTGSLNSGTWWVYDDDKGESHPRRADDPVEFWASIPGEPSLD